MQQTPPQIEPDAPEPANEPHGLPTGRVMHVVYVCAIAATVMGFYFGLRYEPTRTPPPPNQASTPFEDKRTSGLRPATVYAQISGGNLGPNAEWRSVLPEQPELEQLWAYVRPASDQERISGLASRASRRAYHGAPPTIPHEIDPVEHISCVACHGPHGMRLGNEVVASPMPHTHYASCTQCHVPQKALAPDETHWADNRFVGLPEPERGERAWLGAPPTIPHATFLRVNCVSCHGPNGDSGLQSTHPWRTSCTQCHAPSGRLDQVPGAGTMQQYFQQYNLPLEDE